MKDPSVVSGSGSRGSTSSDLLTRLRGQEPGAWSRLVALYGPAVYSWCRRRGLQAEDAADTVQEVFVAVARRVHDFQSSQSGSFRGWLWTITRSKILDHHRRRLRQPEAAGGTDAQQRLLQIPESIEEADAGANTSGELVRRALALLRPEFSETSWRAFWRMAMGSQSVPDIAQDLGITANAVYIAKSRILRRLREELGEIDG